MGGVIQPRDQRHVMLYLLVLTVRMAQYENVIQVIIAKVKQQTKPIVYQDPMLQEKGQFYVLNAHLERMPTLSVPKLAKIVKTMHTNQNPMLRNAFQCKKGSTNQAQQPK